SAQVESAHGGGVRVAAGTILFEYVLPSRRRDCGCGGEQQAQPHSEDACRRHKSQHYYTGEACHLVSRSVIRHSNAKRTQAFSGILLKPLLIPLLSSPKANPFSCENRTDSRTIPCHQFPP